MKLRMAIATTALTLSFQADAHQAVDPRLLQLVPDVPSQEIPDRPGQIRRGRELFLNETFGGNGRTCGTCHEPTNNFTIDPAFIATLPPTSPLFVAETNPALAGLENPDLMHRFGLILENLDGFHVPGVMRGVPHTLALPTSITPDAGTATRPPFPLRNATGWSGDGAPGDGSIRNFALGAVVQHFTRTLQRRPGIDFRLPSRQELTQMETFQLSLGRQADVSIEGDDATAIAFHDANVVAGRDIFIEGVPGRAGTVRSCNTCHDEAGANDNSGNNRQFDTGVSHRPTVPACLGTAPGDGGFLFTPIVAFTLPCNVTATFRGNGQFNTPPLVEAADTPPFFHDNSATTLEDAILHYTTDAFNNSPSGNGNAFVLSDIQIAQISALLRALNARQNLIDGIAIDNRAISEGNNLAPSSIREALSNTTDALRVINESPIAIYGASDIRFLISQAIGAERSALTTNGSHRDDLLRQAVQQKTLAVTRF